jgi:hypothetical protein
MLGGLNVRFFRRHIFRFVQRLYPEVASLANF